MCQSARKPGQGFPPYHSADFNDHRVVRYCQGDAGDVWQDLDRGVPDRYVVNLYRRWNAAQIDRDVVRSGNLFAPYHQSEDAIASL